MTSLLLGVLMLVACGVMYLVHKARGGSPGTQPEGTQVQAPAVVVPAIPQPEVKATPAPRRPMVTIRYQDRNGHNGAEEQIDATQRRPTRTRTFNGRVYVYASVGAAADGVWCYRLIGEERAPSA